MLGGRMRMFLSIVVKKRNWKGQAVALPKLGVFQKIFAGVMHVYLNFRRR
jgi:hypothetical protein